MDKCKYKNLLRDSAKLLSNSQYTHQNTAFLPLDIYTCYDNFLPPSFYMSGASKMSSYYYYSPTGYPYSLINMKPTGPTGATTSTVWNNSTSAATLEYYLPYLRMSAYTGKFRSSVYKWDNNQAGFAYPPVHTHIFNTFPPTVKKSSSVQTTATTFSVFFEIEGFTDIVNPGNSYLTLPRFYGWGKELARTTSNPGDGSINSVGTISAADASRVAGSYDLTPADYSTSLAGVDATFSVVVDSVGGANGGILTVDNIGAADPLRVAATYAIGAADYTTELAGNSATFSIVVDGTGAAAITITTPGKDFVLNETITVPDANLGSGGAAALTFEAATLAGITITDGGTDFVVGETVTVPDANLGAGGAANLTFQAATIAGCCLMPYDNFSTGSSLTGAFGNSVFITTAGTFGNSLATATTVNSNLNYISAIKNGHIIPTPNPITGYINGQTAPGNLGVTGNGGYWHNGECYMSGSSWDLSIGAGNGVLSGMPQFVSSTGNYQGLYTGFATGNVYVYTANCEYKVTDVVPVSQTSSNAGQGSAANCNTYLTKGSFVYSGNGTTASCYLSSGVTHDTLVDDPTNANYAGVNNNTYLHNLYYSPSDHTFIVVSDPPQPKLMQQNSSKIINSDELGSTTTESPELELVVENLSIVSSGDSRFYLTQDPVGDVTLSLNGLVLQKDIEYTHDKREIEIIVDKTVANSVNIKLTDELVVSYVKGTGVVGLISEAATVPAVVTQGGIIRDTTYSTFNYNTEKTCYEYYTEQPIDSSKASDLANLIVLLNGVKLTPNKDYYRSTTIIKLIIFDTGVTLAANDVVTVYYLTDLVGQESGSLGDPSKTIIWSVSPAPITQEGYFEVQVTSSADTEFVTYSTYATVYYRPEVSSYETNIGPFTIANQRYLYRVVNYRTFTSAGAATLTSTATSLTNKFDTLSAAFKSY